MKNRKFLSFVMFLFVTIIFAQSSDDQKIIKDAENAKTEFIKASPKLKEYFKGANAYVIFPNVGKGALIVGAASGNGAVYKNGKLVGMANMKQLDIGAQIGGKAYSEVIFFNTDQAVKEFMDNKFQFGSNISALAADKSAPSMDTAFDNGVAVFTLPKEGLMAEISVGGQKFDYKAFK